MHKQRLLRNSILTLVLVLIICGIFYHWFDIAVEQWFKQQPQGIAYQISNEFFAPVFGSSEWLLAAIISLAIGLWLRFMGRIVKSRPWLFFAVATILAVVVTFVLKYILARYRPELYFSQNLYGLHFFSRQNLLTSMPSGHTTATFAGCYALATIFKRRWLTILLMLVAILTALSRLVLLQHYPSDVIAGAYVGILSVYWVKHYLASR